MLSRIFSALLAAFAVVFSASPSYAQFQGAGFFGSDSDARNIFGPELEITKAPEMAYFPSQPKKPEPKKAAIQKTSGGPGSEPAKLDAPPEEKQNTQDNQENKEDPVAQKLASQFGDPNKEAVVKAVDTAPSPFKGLMAALEEGRDDLAYKYARQYVGYIRRLQERTQKAMAMQGLAMEQEGLLPPGGWQDDPKYASLVDRSLMIESVAEEEEQLKGQTPEMTERIKEMLQKAKANEDASAINPGAADLGSQAGDERSERLKARRIAGSLPRDTKGKVDVYLFMRPNQGRSLDMAKQFEKFFKLRSGSQPQNIVGMVIDSLDPILKEDLRQRTGATFPMVDGRQLSETLKLQQVPVVAFVTQTTKQIHIEPGLPSPFYLDEVLRVMEGR